MNLLFAVVSLAVSHLCVFAVGALVYRNNVKRAEVIIARLQPAYDDLMKKYEEALAKIKEYEEKFK
jgi:hypothetical protein